MLASLTDVKPGRLLLVTDFDGTLAPIVSEPSLARPLPSSIAAMDRLIELGVKGAVISGRSQADLERLAPITGSRLIGEYGLDSPTASEAEALDRFDTIAQGILAGLDGVWAERKPCSTTIHFRLAPWAALHLEATVPFAARDLGLKSFMGRRVIEVRPSRTNKATTLSLIVATLSPQAVVYAGDDESDRDVFEIMDRLPLKHVAIGVFSLEVAPAVFNSCDMIVDGPEGFALFLRGLLERVSRHRAID